jgi:hypothetical protein
MLGYWDSSPALHVRAEEKERLMAKPEASAGTKQCENQVTKLQQ